MKQGLCLFIAICIFSSLPNTASAERIAIKLGPVSEAEFRGQAIAFGYTPIADAVQTQDVFVDSDLKDEFAFLLSGLRRLREAQKAESALGEASVEKFNHELRRFTDLKWAAQWSDEDRRELCYWLSLRDPSEAQRFFLSDSPCGRDQRRKSEAERFELVAPGDQVALNGVPVDQAAHWLFGDAKRLRSQVGRGSGQRNPTDASRKEAAARSGQYRLSFFSSQLSLAANTIYLPVTDALMRKADLIRALDRLRSQAKPWIESRCGTDHALQEIDQKLNQRNTVLHRLWMNAVIRSESFAVLLVGPDGCVQEYNLEKRELNDRPQTRSNATGLKTAGLNADPSGVKLSRLGLQSASLSPIAPVKSGLEQHLEATLRESEDEVRPLYKRPWFWGAIGAVVVTSVVISLQAQQKRSEQNSETNQPTSTKKVGW